jgi:HPt (histidine-containing phosphotransfer) domain-containing protein
LRSSANARQQDVELSGNAGCNQHLSKPISKQKLLSYHRGIRADDSCWIALEAGLPQSIRIEVPPGLAEIVPGYLAARRKELPEMMALLAASGFRAARRLAHNIKGTGGSYGFPELTTNGRCTGAFRETMDAEALSVQLTELNGYLGLVQVG